MWRRHQLAQPFSRGNDFLGRISWNQSYLLEAIIDLYEITGHPVFRDQINQTVNALLDSRNSANSDVPENLPRMLWATRKYSVNQRSFLNLLVNDSRTHCIQCFARRDWVFSQIRSRKKLLKQGGR